MKELVHCVGKNVGAGQVGGIWEQAWTRLIVVSNSCVNVALTRCGKVCMCIHAQKMFSAISTHDSANHSPLGVGKRCDRIKSRTKVDADELIRPTVT